MQNNNKKIEDNVTEKVTVAEFINQVWEVEHVKIKVNNVPDINTALIDPYPYDKEMCANGEITVEEFLETRIRPCLETILVPAPIAVVSDIHNN